MILPLIFLTFLYLLQPILSISNDTLIFGYSLKGDDDFTNYQYTLHNLLGTLSSQTSITRYSNFTTTSPKTPNHKLHGVYLCRGDIDPQACQSCINSAKKFILRDYPDRSEALVWYNHCMIRYSNQSFFGKLDESMWTASRDNTKVKGNRFQFMNTLRRTLKGLATQASKNENKFASTVLRLTMMEEALNLHAMVQCTPDLVGSDCFRCLMYANQKILGMYGSTSGRVFYKSCFVQYKTIDASSNNKIEPFPSSSTAVKDPPILHLRVKIQPISSLNNSSSNWHVTNSTRICFKVRFGIPPLSNETGNSSSTFPSWAIANSSLTFPTLHVELKDNADVSEGQSKGWETA